MRSSIQITATAFAFVFLTSIMRASAQLVNQGGGLGQIEYAAEPVVNTTSLSPVWSTDTFTEAVLHQPSLNDFMENPGDGLFNSVGYGTYGNIVFTNSMAPLGSALTLGAAPGTYNGLAFGGGNLRITPSSVASTVSANTPGDYTLVNACQTSNYVVGPQGLGATIGTYLSISGTLTGQGDAGTSLVTYIDDTTTGHSVVLAEVLAAGQAQNASQMEVALSGEFDDPVAGPNSWLLFGNGGTTYTGFASASATNFTNVGDNVTVTTAFSQWADPDLEFTIDTDSFPDDLGGAALPASVLFGSVQMPEPSTSVLAIVGLSGILLRRSPRKMWHTR